jgi:hypothetical protein
VGCGGGGADAHPHHEASTLRCCFGGGPPLDGRAARLGELRHRRPYRGEGAGGAADGGVDVPVRHGHQSRDLCELRGGCCQNTI